MLCFDYLQPSIDGRHLAVVHYRPVGGTDISAAGLVRCPLDLVDRFSKHFDGLAAHRNSYQSGQRLRAKFVMPEVTYYSDSCWQSHGLEVIQSLPTFGVPGQGVSKHRNFSEVMSQLLQHPVWISTGLAWALHHNQVAQRHPARRRRI